MCLILDTKKNKSSVHNFDIINHRCNYFMVINYCKH